MYFCKSKLVRERNIALEFYWEGDGRRLQSWRILNENRYLPRIDSDWPRREMEADVEVLEFIQKTTAR
jgi:hypothetical protein